MLCSCSLPAPILHLAVCVQVWRCSSLRLPLPSLPPLGLQVNVLHLASILALQISPSASFSEIQYICVNVWYLLFSLWLTSLCVTGSKFIHLTKTVSNTSLYMAKYCSIVYMHGIFFICSSVDEHLGCFRTLTIVMVLWWTLGHMHLFEIGFSQGTFPVPRSLSHMIILFLKNLHIVPHSDWINLYSHKHCKRVPFSPHPLHHISFLDFFDDGPSDWCEVLPHCTHRYAYISSKLYASMLAC